MQIEERGMSLVECVATVALVGIGVMMACALLGLHPRAIEQIDAQTELVRSIEATIEAVRAGELPLTSGAVPRSALPAASTARALSVTLTVSPGGAPGLYRIEVRASGRAVGRRLERRQSSMVWRPS